VSDPLGRLTPVVRLAPAKLNLTLAVVGRRPDGFHAIHSVMVPLDLADRLALGPAFGPADRLHVTGPGGAPPPDLGAEASNLVLRAIEVARRAVRAGGVGGPLPALAARLEKRIPVAAGLVRRLVRRRMRRSTARWRPGASAAGSPRPRGRRPPLRRSDCPSSWPAAGRSSRGAASASRISTRRAERRPASSS